MHIDRETIKTRPAVEEAIVGFLERTGMPRHCGLCGRFWVCSKGDAELLCPWLKFYRWLAKKSVTSLIKADKDQ